VRALASIVVAFAVLACLGYLLAPGQFALCSVYKKSVCLSCGLERVDDIRKLGPFVYHRQVDFQESGVSRALKIKSCPHSWFLYRYEHNFIRPLNSWRSSWGCPSVMLQSVLRDDAFCEELAHMDNASENWSSLVTALNSNHMIDDSFGLWWKESTRRSFSSWAATNGLWTQIGSQAAANKPMQPTPR
jgi:hypothetical protein